MLWATAHQFRKPSSNDPLLRVGEGGGVALSKKNFLTQVVDIVPAGSYNLRMDVSCPVAGTKIRMQINWIDKNDVLFDTSIAVRDCGPERQTLTTHITAPEAAATGILYLVSHDPGVMCCIRFSLKDAK